MTFNEVIEMLYVLFALAFSGVQGINKNNQRVILDEPTRSTMPMMDQINVAKYAGVTVAIVLIGFFIAVGIYCLLCRESKSGAPEEEFLNQEAH